MNPENLPPLENLTATEHVEQLASIGQQSQKKNKYSGQKKSRTKKPDIQQLLEEEQNERLQNADDGHVDYHA